MKPVSIRIPDLDLERLQQLAAAEDRDVSWLIRRAIRNYLHRDAEPSHDTREHAVS